MTYNKEIGYKSWFETLTNQSRELHIYKEKKT